MSEVEVRDLTVEYQTSVGWLPAVAGASLDLRAGQITGLVGESGSGKSTLALSLLNAVPAPGRIAGGTIEVAGVGDLTRLGGKQLRKARGGAIGYVFQASQNSLNPLKTIGRQLLDLGRSHEVGDLRALIARAKDLANRMGLDGDRVLDSYQHELSGGMRQRVGIVFALVLNAKVLILDEPTTALDMLSQASVLDIVRKVHDENQLSTLIITHDIGAISEIADRLAVMYGGRIVEDGPLLDVLRRPTHPYTKALIGATARITGDVDGARALPGRPPDLTTVARAGCVFRDRCPFAVEVCAQTEPELETFESGRRRACHVEPSTVLTGPVLTGTTGTPAAVGEPA
ncbi:ABC transporter ATP-binding protein [Catenulispora pinisilvae]|uniref:ABC transporter ATP-binding protein n=1 Tax=Catenulispora pinisilvae TaxID=2705253 RepID=UPI001892812D|nr:ABC transporter ATP-binding protein [Catenulispora pinisilvae]